MTILEHSRYSPARGGHAPGDVRDAFLEALEDMRGWRTGTPEPTAEVRGQAIPISRLCGLLWNCTDIMPGHACGDMQHVIDEFPNAGATYAQAARALKALIAQS